MSDADYKQGFVDGLTAYAIWNDGEQTVGSLGRTLKNAVADVERTWNYMPPSGPVAHEEDFGHD